MGFSTDADALLKRGAFDARGVGGGSCIASLSRSAEGARVLLGWAFDCRDMNSAVGESRMTNKKRNLQAKFKLQLCHVFYCFHTHPHCLTPALQLHRSNTTVHHGIRVTLQEACC